MAENMKDSNDPNNDPNNPLYDPSRIDPFEGLRQFDDTQTNLLNTVMYRLYHARPETLHCIETEGWYSFLHMVLIANTVGKDYNLGVVLPAERISWED